MSIHSTITRARAAQEKLFLDSSTVARQAGEPVLDPETGEVTTPTTVVYSGRCRILPDANRSSDDVTVGETLIGTPDFTIRFPVDSDIERDDIVTITACQYDAAAVGKQYVVRKAQNDGRQFARITVCEEYVVPGEEGS